MEHSYNDVMRRENRVIRNSIAKWNSAFPKRISDGTEFSDPKELMSRAKLVKEYHERNRVIALNN